MSARRPTPSSEGRTISRATIDAAAEVPFMIALGYARTRLSKERILAMSRAIFGVHPGFMRLARSVLRVTMFQLVAAIAIASLMNISIRYPQGVIEVRVGLSASSNDVTLVASVMAASAIFALNSGGACSPRMAVAGSISMAGAVLMILSDRMTKTAAKNR